MVSDSDRLIITFFGVAPATFLVLFPSIYLLPTAILGVIGGNPRLLWQVVWIVLAVAGTAGLWWVATSKRPFLETRKTILVGLLLCGMMAVGIGMPAALQRHGGELLLGLLLIGPLVVGALALALTSGSRMSVIGLGLAALMSVASVYGT